MPTWTSMPKGTSPRPRPTCPFDANEEIDASVDAAEDAAGDTGEASSDAVGIVSLSVTPTFALFNFVCTNSVQLTATAIFSDMSQRDVTTMVTWSSSEPTIAGVGANTGLVTEGTQGGTVGITASLLGGQFWAESTILVDPLMPVTVVVTPADASIPVRGTAALHAEVTLADASHCDASNLCAWQSSAVNVTTVSAGGVVTGVAAGSATVTATVFSVLSGSAQVTVQ